MSSYYNVICKLSQIEWKGSHRLTKADFTTLSWAEHRFLKQQIQKPFSNFYCIIYVMHKYCSCCLVSVEKNDSICQYCGVSVLEEQATSSFIKLSIEAQLHVDILEAIVSYPSMTWRAWCCCPVCRNDWIVSVESFGWNMWLTCKSISLKYCAV